MAQEKRVNYFQGMMLVDQDFKDDQTYHRRMRHNHNLELHTWGVVRGLEVTIDRTVVTVAEGLAIDASGKEIWWAGGAIQPAGSAAEGSYLVIEAVEEFRDDYPQMTGKYLRLIDTAKFSWKNPKAEGDVVLAQLTQGQPDPGGRRIASSVRVNGSNIEIRPVTKEGFVRVMTGAPMNERLTIGPTGNVGIGTTDPQARLHLKFPDAARGNAAVLNLEGTDHVYMQWFPLGFSAGRKAWMGFESANEKNFKIKNEYADGHLLLASGSGKVGIGTSRPGFALQVGDADNIVDARLCIAGRGDSDHYRQWTLRTGDKDGATVDPAKTKEIHKLRIRDEQGNADRLVIDQDGNVGLGVSNPQNRLEVRGHLAIREGMLKFADDKGDYYPDNWIGMSTGVEGTTKWLHIGGITDASARRLALYADITYVSGKLGIGTTSPQDRLQIGDGYSKVCISPSPKGPDQNLYDADYGTAYLGLNVIKATNKWHRDGDGTTNNGASLIYNTIKGQLCFVTLEPGNADLSAAEIVNRKRMVIDERGVGIGTSDLGSSKFKIAKSASDFVNVRFLDTGMGQLEIVGWSGGWNINAMTNEKNLYLNRDSAEKSNVLIGRSTKELFVRGSDGNVGIGTTTPGGQLEIRNPATSARVKFGGAGGDVHHLTSTRDMVFNAVAGGFTFRLLNSAYEDLSKFDDLMRLNQQGDLWVRGGIASGMFSAETIINNTGPLPLSATLKSGGGTLIIFVSGSAFRPTNVGGGTIGVHVHIDNQAAALATLRGYTNETTSHKALVSFPIVTKLSAGSHTIELRPLDTSVYMDGNDHFRVTILQLPF